MSCSSEDKVLLAHERMISKQLESSPVCDLCDALILLTQTLELSQFGLAMLRGPQMLVQDWRQETKFEVNARGVPPQRFADIQEHQDVAGHRGQELQIQNTRRRGRGFRAHIDEEKLLV